MRIDRLSTDADEPDKSGQQPMERMPSYLSEEFEARSASRKLAKQHSAGIEQKSPERTDEPHEVEPPQIVCAY